MVISAVPRLKFTIGIVLLNFVLILPSQYNIACVRHLTLIVCVLSVT